MKKTRLSRICVQSVKSLATGSVGTQEAEADRGTVREVLVADIPESLPNDILQALQHCLRSFVPMLPNIYRQAIVDEQKHFGRGRLLQLSAAGKQHLVFKLVSEIDEVVVVQFGSKLTYSDKRRLHSKLTVARCMGTYISSSRTRSSVKRTSFDIWTSDEHRQA